MTVLPQTMDAAVMPAMMAKGKFQGGMTAPTPSGNVAELVALAGELDGGGGLVEAEGFAAVELEEVDGLAYVGVGLGPVFADLEGEPGAELEFALADEVGGAEEQGGALCDGCGSRCRRRPGRPCIAASACSASARWWTADDLGGAGRVGGDDLVFGLEAAAADDEVVLVAELVSDVSESLLACRRLFSGSVKSTKGSLVKGVCAVRTEMDGMRFRVAIAGRF